LISELNELGVFLTIGEKSKLGVFFFFNNWREKRSSLFLPLTIENCRNPQEEEFLKRKSYLLKPKDNITVLTTKLVSLKYQQGISVLN
jgi:hypothetical protein